MGLKDAFRDFRKTVHVWFSGLDAPLLWSVVVLGILSALNLYGVGGADHTLFRRQLVLIVLGVVVMLVVSTMNYRYLKNWTVPVLLFYGLSTALLASTLWFSEIRNIRAWVVVGGFQFEPSELVKLALVILLAKYFSQRHVHINQFRHILASGIYVGIPTAIVLVQPDLGSAAIMGIVWLAMLLSVGINRKHLFLLVALALVGGYLAWIWGLAPYQKDRILAFVDPYRDPSGYGYHIIQSQTAIGAGGWLGQGLGNGSQATLGYLPEPYNDFAFAAFVEQFGFVGAMIVVGIACIVVWRILSIGRASANNFARLFCIGVAAVIGAHVFISASVNIGLLPVTGIPFSFLSYGGSHLLSLSVALGVVQSVARHG